MPTFIHRYIHVITQEATALAENKFEKLNPMQRQVIQTILHHTRDLSMMLTETQTGREIRHELLNLLTPVSGYVDMLYDGWLGELSEYQHEHIKLIIVAVHRLTEYIRSYPIKSEKTVASL